jgi:hypothetical protein
MTNYSILKSKTFWAIVFAFVFNGFAAISGQVPTGVTVVVDAILGALQTIFHLAGVNAAAVASANAQHPASGQ